MNHPPRFDLLRLPAIGRFLRWRWGRLVLQMGMLGITAVLLYDGITGPQLAPNNLATVVTWVQFRGFVMLALLLVGNLFCMACPFALPRTLAHRFSQSQRRFPQRLRNKWTAIVVLLLYLWLYEWLDLWSSPLFTVWLIVGYFIASFLLEAFFKESPFCKYVCPLGTFNYTAASISPLQIQVNDGDVCRTCVGKECVNGTEQKNEQQMTRMDTKKEKFRANSRNSLLSLPVINPPISGCGTELFAPQIKSNMDCTFCLDCARACPHDNIALAARSPLHEATAPDAWGNRWDRSLLVFIFAFAGLSNAFGMVPPVYTLEAWLAAVLHIQHEGVILFLILGGMGFVLPMGLVGLTAVLSRHTSPHPESIRHTIGRYAPAFLPFAFAIWFAHYAGFHFLSSALTLIPVFQQFLLDHNVALLGAPNWAMGPLLPLTWLDPIEMVVLLIGFAASLYAIGERAQVGARGHAAKDNLLPQLPWIALLLLLAVAAMFIFYLPMEMRGTGFVG